MKVYRYSITTKGGEAFGSLEAESEDEARKYLSESYQGQLQDEDGNPFNNDVESIDLKELI